MASELELGSAEALVRSWGYEVEGGNVVPGREDVAVPASRTRKRGRRRVPAAKVEDAPKAEGATQAMTTVKAEATSAPVPPGVVPAPVPASPPEPEPEPRVVTLPEGVRWLDAEGKPTAEPPVAAAPARGRAVLLDAEDEDASVGKAGTLEAVECFKGLAANGLRVSLVPLAAVNLAPGQAVELRCDTGGDVAAWVDDVRLGAVDRDHVSIYSDVEREVWGTVLPAVAARSPLAIVAALGDGPQPFMDLSLDLEAFDWAALGEAGVCAAADGHRPLEGQGSESRPGIEDDDSDGHLALIVGSVPAGPTADNTPSEGSVAADAGLIPGRGPAFEPDRAVLESYRRHIAALEEPVADPKSPADDLSGLEARVAELEALAATIEAELDGLGFFRRSRRRWLTARAGAARSELDRARGELAVARSRWEAHGLKTEEAARQRAVRRLVRVLLIRELAAYERGELA